MSVTGETEAPEQHDLQVPNPNPEGKGFFGLLIPSGCVERDFETIRWHIEFRRKCNNQGFDNLLELLNKLEQTLKAQREPEEAK